MNTFILPSNANMYDAKKAINDLKVIPWVQNKNKSVSVGDTIYIYESNPTHRVILKTEVIDRDVTSYDIDDSRYSKPGTDFSNRGPWFSLKLLNNIEEPISLKDLRNWGLKGNIQSLQLLDESVASALDCLVDDTAELTSFSLTEGKQIKVYSTRYERNPKNRQAAIKIHGLNCKACGFNFEKKYGIIGRDFIEIHHRTPLYLNGHEVNIDPKTDLVPVCSNCHRMIHKDRYNVITVEELRKQLSD